MSDNFSRRAFLKSAPLAAVAVSLPIAGCADAAVAATPQQEVDAAANALLAAMTRLHGDGCRIIRNGYLIVSVVEPYKPRIVEFAGDGDYEVEITGGRRPIWTIAHAPARDGAIGEGRCFKCAQAGFTGHFYIFEKRLRTMLIRKI